MTKPTDRTIGAFARQWEADLAIAWLREQGLHPADLQVFSHASTGAGADQVYRVTVPEGEAAAAVALLEAQGYGKNVVPTR